MHPWERDARLAHEAVTKGPQGYSLLIEIACTRSSEELFEARKAYQSLFDRSLEDVASRIEGTACKVSTTLVSLRLQMNYNQNRSIIYNIFIKLRIFIMVF